jgi:hypothetical protein
VIPKTWADLLALVLPILKRLLSRDAKKTEVTDKIKNDNESGRPKGFWDDKGGN